jgi:hypothetical protein
MPKTFKTTDFTDDTDLMKGLASKERIHCEK